MKPKKTAAMLAFWSLLFLSASAWATLQPSSPQRREALPVTKSPDRAQDGPRAAAPPDGETPPAVFVSHEPGKDSAYAILVEKASQSLTLYEMQEPPRPVFRMRCSTGKNPGPKTVSGDAKTPEGVYFFHQEFDEKHLSPIYGVKAFPTDYPNLMDRLAQRTGSAIWLHGTDKPLKPYDSNGCVTVENADLLALSPFITLNRTPIIIVERIPHPHGHGGGKDAAAVEALLESWRRAVESGSGADLTACYEAGAWLPSWWEEWTGRQAILTASGAPLCLEMKAPAVFRTRNTLVAVCDPYLRAGGAPVRAGVRQFFMEYQDGRLVILADTDPAVSGERGEDPLLAASRSIRPGLHAQALKAGMAKPPGGFRLASSGWPQEDHAGVLPLVPFDPLAFLHTDVFPLPVLERKRPLNGEWEGPQRQPRRPGGLPGFFCCPMNLRN